MKTRTVKASPMAACLTLLVVLLGSTGLDSPFVRDVRPDQGGHADRCHEAVRSSGQPR